MMPIRFKLHFAFCFMQLLPQQLHSEFGMASNNNNNDTNNKGEKSRKCGQKECSTKINRSQSAKRNESQAKCSRQRQRRDGNFDGANWQTERQCERGRARESQRERQCECIKTRAAAALPQLGFIYFCKHKSKNKMQWESAVREREAAEEREYRP